MNGIIRLGLCIMVGLLLLPALSAGAQGDSVSLYPSISADGRDDYARLEELSWSSGEQFFLSQSASAVSDREADHITEKN